MSIIFKTYAEEVEDTRLEAAKEGVSKYDWDKQSASSVALVKSLGFVGPEDVRRVALANGRIERW